MLNISEYGVLLHCCAQLQKNGKVEKDEVVIQNLEESKGEISKGEDCNGRVLQSERGDACSKWDLPSRR
jgi:hypothetical protein